MKLFLDDVRPAPAGWVLARSVDEAIQHVKDYYIFPWTPLEVSLDFDLGMTGAHCETCNDRGWGRLHDHPDYCPDCSHEILTIDESAPTGIMLLYWFLENDLIPDKIYLHTANPVGLSSMQWAVRDMQKKYDREWPEAFR